MQRFLSAPFLSFAVILLTATTAIAEGQTMEKKGQFAYLMGWVGKMPFAVRRYDPQLKEKPHGALWAIPDVRQSLEATMGKKRFQQFLKGRIGGIEAGMENVGFTDIERVGNGIAFTANVIHSLPTTLTAFFISTNDGKAQVCWPYEEVKQVASKQKVEETAIWLSPVGNRFLPLESCFEAFADGSLQKVYDTYSDEAKSRKVN